MSSVQHRTKLRAGTARLAALDIGCSKVTCFIGHRSDGPHGFTLTGGGRQQSRGFEQGSITDMEGLERAIRLAVEDAERQAGEQIEGVILGVAGANVSASLVSAQTETTGREISARDVRRVISVAVAKATLKGLHVLSAYPIAYQVDGQGGVREPIGMIGSRVGVHLNVVTAPKSIITNLVECVGRAHLSVESMVPSAIASGAGTLIEDERDNGAICIDMGAGVTAVSAFLHGAPAWLDLVRSGGAHVTSDLAQGLGTTFAAAERLKTIYGTADQDGPSLAERIECPVLGDDGRLNATRLPKSRLAEIIAPRVEETFEIVRARMDASAVGNVLPRRAVLTGGASQLSGVREVASRVLGMPVRLGRPRAADSLGEVLAAPGFSTASGLLTYELAGLSDVMQAGHGYRPGGELPGFGPAPWKSVNRAFRWLRENF